MHALRAVVVAVLAALSLACGGSGGGGKTASVPSAPTGVFAAGGDAQVTISWDAVPSATSYSIYWSTTSGVTTAHGTRIPGVTSPYVHTGLTNGIPCYYIVTALNSDGESAPSLVVSATPVRVTAQSLVWDQGNWEEKNWN
jgi:hypothetical protein